MIGYIITVFEPGCVYYDVESNKKNYEAERTAPTHQAGFDKFLDVLFIVLCSQSFSKAICFDQKKYSNQMNIHIFMYFHFGDGANGRR